MYKLDLKRNLKDCYTGKKKVKFVEVPPVNYVAITGKGNPNTSQEYKDAIETLFGMVYTIKFMCKAEGDDFVVMPLEGCWWTDPIEDFSINNKDKWLWEAMIALPDFVDKETFELARAQLKKKKNPVSIDKAQLKRHEDGLSAQILYTGPYSNEGKYIEEMHKSIEEEGYKLRGKHREIYLSNPQRVASEKLRTIIRQPIERRIK